MKRVNGWEKLHKAVIDKHMALPSKYGVSDCYMICDDNVEAITGEIMYPKARGYKSEKGAARKLINHGFKNVEEAFAEKFEQLDSPFHAHRGDIGVICDNGQICGGIFTALGFMTRTQDNKCVFVSINKVKTAFKVGR